MALQNLFGDVNLEATQQEMLAQMTLLLAAILDKLPRVDTNDRVMVSHAESNPTVALVTTQGTLQNLGALYRPADGIPHHISNAGTMHIYDNIKVS